MTAKEGLDVELFDDKFWDRSLVVGDRLRERTQVHQAVLPNHMKVYVLTRYPDVRGALADDRLSKDVTGLLGIIASQRENGTPDSGQSDMLSPHMLFRN